MIFRDRQELNVDPPRTGPKPGAPTSMLEKAYVRYFGAIAIVVVAFLLRKAMIDYLGVELPPFTTLYPAVMLVALLAGWGPGMLATLLATMMAYYWIFPPIRSFAIASKSDVFACVFFLGMGVFMSIVAERYRRGQEQVAAHKQQQAWRESADRLRQGEEQFEALANSMPQLCWMANPDGGIFWYNQRWYEYTGTTPEEMKGWAWQSVHNPDTLPKVLDQWKTSIATATPFEMVLPLKGIDGEFRSFLTRVVPVMDGSGKVVRWFGTNTDINERIQAEEILLRSKARLDLAVEVACLGEWEQDLQNGAGSHSQRHAEIFGYETPQREWNFKIFLSHVLPNRRSEIEAQVDAALVTGVWDFETQISRVDGAIRWIWARGRRVLDAAGQPVRMYGIVIDVTPRKLAKEAQAADREKLDVALASMSDAVVISDVRGEFIKFNDAFAAFCRFRNTAECSGRFSELGEYLDLLTGDGELVPMSARPVPRALRGETATNVEYHHQRKDTGETWIGSYSFSPLRDGTGTILGAVMVARDITERKRSEEVLRVSERRYSALFANKINAIAHCRVVSDAHGLPVDYCVLDINEAYERIIGMKKADIEGRSAKEVFPGIENYKFDYIGVFGKVGLEGGEIMTEVFLEATGQTLSIYAYSPVRGEFTAIFTDITERKLAEEALLKSETLYRGLFSSMSEGFCIIELIFNPEGKPVDFRFVEVNAAFEEQTGLHEAVGKRMREFVPSHEEYWFEVFGRVALTGEPAHFLNEAKAMDAHFEVRAYRVGEPDQRRVAIVFDEVSERKRTEQHIRKLSRIYAVLSDINQTIVREKDSQAMLSAACQIAVKQGQFRMAWIGMLDPSTQELNPIASSGIEDGYLDFRRINMQESTHTGGPAARCVQSGRHAICNDIEFDPLFLPWRDDALRRGYRSSGGFPLTVEGKVVGVFMLYADEPAFFDDEELVLLDEMAMDISFALEVNRHEEDRRKAEEELRWRTAFFEAQVESALDGIMVVDHDGTIILQNKRVSELWKMPAEIESKDYSAQVEFVVSRTKNPDQFVEKMEHLNAHPDEVSQDEVELLDGTILERYSSPVKDRVGKYYGRIWFFHEITKRRQLEGQFRQAQKMEAVGQLTGGIAHDFNNLLGVIVGNLDLLERLVPENEVALKRVHTAQRAAERGADLTGRLLAFCSSVELRPSSTDLHDCVRNMIELGRAVGPDVRFTTHFDDSVPQVFVDAAALESALLNLVVNARDAMPNGGSLTISTQLRSLDGSYPLVQAGELRAGRYASVSVSDTGQGMSKETVERVFEPFFTTKPRGKGTGLGLAMVYGFARQSGGAVRIYSELGHGTTVTLYLRLADDVTQPLPAVGATLPTRALTGKVLVVDDEPDLLDIAIAYLEQTGFTAYQAADGASALDVLELHTDINLIVTDIIMPGGMNGVELAQKVHQLLPQIKIIYSSGFPADSLAERNMPALDGPLLRKPYQRTEFDAAIRRALS